MALLTVHYHWEGGRVGVLGSHKYLLLIASFVAQRRWQNFCNFCQQLPATTISQLAKHGGEEEKKQEQTRRQGAKMQKTLCIKCKIVLNNFCYFTIIFHRSRAQVLSVCLSVVKTEVLQAAPCCPYPAQSHPLCCTATASLSAAAFYFITKGSGRGGGGGSVELAGNRM